MALREPLDPVESRIFGTLVEKSLTTPESYPLSINSLVNGCNQKSNRHPVSDLTETTINEALLRLRLHHLAREVHSAGARVVKYDHDGGAVLDVDKPSLAVLAELLLRGPQQPGELRGRASRMAEIKSLDELERLLADLAGRGMVLRLPPEPGSRAARWCQRLSPGLHGESKGAPAAVSNAPAAAATTGPVHRVEVSGVRPGATSSGESLGVGTSGGGAGHAPTAPAPTATPSAGFGSAVAPGAVPSAAPSAAPSAEVVARLAALERRVAALEARLDASA